jgi:hypothetical protein
MECPLCESGMHCEVHDGPVDPLPDVKPPTFKVRAHSYVWCDVHCEIHQRVTNPYDDGNVCGKRHWRKVYVRSTDPHEEF